MLRTPLLPKRTQCYTIQYLQTPARRARAPVRKEGGPLLRSGLADLSLALTLRQTGQRWSEPTHMEPMSGMLKLLRGGKFSQRIPCRRWTSLVTPPKAFTRSQLLPAKHPDSICCSMDMSIDRTTAGVSGIGPDSDRFRALIQMLRQNCLAATWPS